MAKLLSSSLICFISINLLSSGITSAAVLTWHPSQGVPKLPGGDGEWRGVGGGPQNLWRNETGERFAWIDGSDVVFAGTAGVVRIEGPTVAAGLSANASGFTVSANQLGVAGAISLAENVTLTLSGGGDYSAAQLHGAPGSHLILNGSSLVITGTQNPDTTGPVLSLAGSTLGISGDVNLAGMVVQADSIIDFGTGGGALSLPSVNLSGGILRIYNWNPATTSLDFGGGTHDSSRIIYYSDEGITQVTAIPEPRPFAIGVWFCGIVMARRFRRSAKGDDLSGRRGVN